ncbi:hypothetical protein BGZ65_002632, partial [Modicella reniformis]
MPKLFLIAPPLGDPFAKGTYQPFRILTPCQGPSLLPCGTEDSIHLTAHEGFTIKNPRSFVHGSRNVISTLNAVKDYVFLGASAAASSNGVFLNPAAVISGPLARLHQTAQNRVHLKNAGLDPLDYYSKQRVVDNGQITAMKTIFQSANYNLSQNMFEVRPIVVERTTKWVCEECYQQLSHGDSILVDHLVSLKEYADLMTSRRELVDVTLRCSASVSIFTRAVQSNSRIRKVIIRVESGYFQTPERQRSSSQYSTIKNQFDDLGKALSGLPLTSIEIYGDRDCGTVFSGLQRALKCNELEAILIKNIPQFLSGLDVTGHSNKLTTLVLDGVYINTMDTAHNLTKILVTNSDLRILRLSRSELTMDTLQILESNERVRKRFTKLTHLNISNNNFGYPTAVTLVNMTLQSDNLTHLSIAGSPGITDVGCNVILDSLLRSRPGDRRLEAIVTDGTGISDDTATRMDCIRKS